MQRKGKLIVCEGIDGSGKYTQFVLLQKRLEKSGFKVAVFDFPRYGTPPHGEPPSWFVRKYLRKPEFGFERGYGSAREVGPYVASLFYALDRYDAAFCNESRPNLTDLIAEGCIILSNRYTQSNIGHQASKIVDPTERRTFVEWLLKTEYDILQIPKPDLVLLFNMLPSIAVTLKEKQRTGQSIKKDAHEEDPAGLEKSHRAYLEAAEMFPDHWVVINAYDELNNVPLEPSKIHEMVWQEVMKRLKS
jgi:dTMP kinase